MGLWDHESSSWALEQKLIGPVMQVSGIGKTNGNDGGANVVG